MDKETIDKQIGLMMDVYDSMVAGETTRKEWIDAREHIDFVVKELLQSQTQDIIKKVEGMKVEVVGDDRIAIQNNITIDGVLKVINS